MLAGYTSMPNLPPPAATTQTANSAWGQGQAGRNSNAQLSNAQLMDNPHFAASQNNGQSVASGVSNHQSAPRHEIPMPGYYQSQNNSQTVQNQFARQPVVEQPTKLPANQVSFQPRANPSPAITNPSAALGTKVSPVAPAIDGFCPVALKQQGAWVKGQSQFAVRHRGRVYWLNSRDAMDEFLANPDASSPVLSGYDPMTFLNEGQLVEGSIQFGLHEQVSGAILLFTSAESKQAYERDFDRNTKALEVLLQSAGMK
jgi:hypothetical protein